jgi:protein SCO1
MTDAAVGNRRLRIALLFVGGVLWAVVFVVLYLKWQQRQQTVADSGTAIVDPRPTPVFQSWEVPDFKLSECRGRTVGKSDLLGRPWVASFLFTRCRESCPRVRAQLRLLKDRIGKTGARLVTITVDPEHDTPAVLKRHAAELNAEPDRWMFLTGKQKEIYDLIEHGFQMSVMQNTGTNRRPGDEVSHSQYVLLIDAKGFVVGRYDGTSEIEMAKLERAIRNLRAAESPQRRKPTNG